MRTSAECSTSLDAILCACLSCAPTVSMYAPAFDMLHSALSARARLVYLFHFTLSGCISKFLCFRNPAHTLIGGTRGGFVRSHLTHPGVYSSKDFRIHKCHASGIRHVVSPCLSAHRRGEHISLPNGLVKNPRAWGSRVDRFSEARFGLCDRSSFKHEEH